MAEWFKAPLLKSGRPQGLVGSNPTLSASCMEDSQTNDTEGIHAGRHLLSWQVDEYPRATRSGRWYAAACVIGAALIIYAIASADFLFAVIVLMLGIIYLVSTFREPERVDVTLTDGGVVLGTTFYEYRDIKDFSLVYEPPAVKNLYLEFVSPWRPLLTIPLEETDPNVLRETLLPYCKEDLERTRETLTDAMRRVYKL
jgi:hypothetical protein